MSHLLVVGSVAFDTVETPYGKREFVLGGSANFFSMSSSFFAPVRMVAVVGEDFPQEHLERLAQRGVDLEGLQRTTGKTFHWTGVYYGEDMNQAHTLDTQLNVFEHFTPQLPESYRETKTVLLANIDPELQLKVLEQIKSPRLVACDTMNFWISGKRMALMKVLEHVDLFLLNEKELKDLSGQRSLLSGVHWLRERGPQIIVVKRGEYGAMLFYRDMIFSAPAFPLEDVRDPTGAGDTFAGGLLGYLADVEEINELHLRRAMIAGSVMASFVVEQFSCDRLISLTPDEIQQRFLAFQKLVHFDASHELPLR